MRLACVACRETLVVAPLAVGKREGGDDAKQHAASEDLVEQTRLAHDEMAVCVGCDGFFHIPCLEKQQKRGEDGDGAETQDWKTMKTFECARCSNLLIEGTGVLPLLVPAGALQYLGSEHAERTGATSAKSTSKKKKTQVQTVNKLPGDNSDSDQDERADDWVVFSKEIEVCTTCRQVQIPASDRVSCSACSAPVFHQQCCAQANPLSSDIPVQVGVSPSGQRAKKAPARKRKRPLPATATVPAQQCSHVQNATGLAGVISTRKLAILARRSAEATESSSEGDGVKWWRSCQQCSLKFCLQEFCDQEPSDAKLSEILDSSDSSSWKCLHCTTEPKSVSLSASEALLEKNTEKPVPAQAKSAVKSAVSNVPSGGAVVTTSLICAGCENATHSLRAARDGGWLCAACVSATAAQVQEPSSSVVETQPPAQELVTLLICDGCDGEFDFAQIVPRLDEVPSGDWYCGMCSGTTPPAEQALLLPSLPIPLPVAALEAEQLPLIDVTLLICDSCEGEFDMGTLNPPLAQIPEGDWFCQICEAARRNRAKSKNRRSKKGKRPAKPNPVVPPLVPATIAAVPEELVTMLICDGCEGEWDAAFLDPPLSAIPEGDWFCNACDANRAGGISSSKASSDGLLVQTQPSTLRGKVEEADASLMKGSPVPAAISSHGGEDTQVRPIGVSDVVESQGTSLTVDESSQSSANRRVVAGKKRKRGGIGYQAKRRGKLIKKNEELPIAIPPVADSIERIELESSVSGVHIPFPVNTSSWSGNRDDKDGSMSNGGSATASPMLVLSDDDGGDSDDQTEDSVVIVCDMCLADFNMIDVVGGSTTRAAPPRPWYCNSCVKSLKRTRKKRQRFSKQMLLEMQIYGELLRPTSAKAYDLKAAALRGKAPKTTSELKSMFALVGRRVGIFLKWDKHWVMGRVLSFEVSHPAFHHVVRFEDGVEKSLPLYAFPMVIGTQMMLYVKVPTLQNQWWPSQLLRLNPMAKKILTPEPEDDDAAMANFRLVSIYASTDCMGKTQNVSCWVPKYLCRSMAKFSPRSAADHSIDPVAAQTTLKNFSTSVERAIAERSRENEVLQAAFQKLAKKVYTQSADRQLQFADALIGLELTDATQAFGNLSDGHAAFKATRIDAESKLLVLERDQVRTSVDLGSPANRFFLHKSSEFAEIAVQFSTKSTDDSPSQQEKETRAALDAAVSSSMPNGSEVQDPEASTADLAEQEPCCSLCLLPARVVDEEPASESDEELVECVKCSQSFHLACCDPPHDPTPLVNEEDGTVMLADLKTPFVCSKCATCAGCSKRFDAHQDFTDKANSELIPPTWSQWRLPLQIASLCADCVPYYSAKQYCTVCLKVLNDDALATCSGLHSCSTCQLWVHAECEPDPHPAFLACKSSTEFELDVQVELPDLLVPVNGSEHHETTANSSVSDASGAVVKAAPSEVDFAGESKPAKLVDEDFAFGLTFKDSYDPKVMNKYECLTCRKSRMLHVIHRLKSEDKLELFKEPVTKKIAPTYFDVIKQPMDLSTMLKKIMQTEYTRVNFRDFRDDFELMCLNAVTFNSKERDFLIWREAWRFYGQGQRILRQTAPKSRMKHRGGKYHDALLAAAKRQLPNNSAIGKKRAHDGFDLADDDFGGSANGDNDDDLDMLEDDRGNGDQVNGADDIRDGADAEKPAEREADAAAADSASGEVQVKNSETSTALSSLPSSSVSAVESGVVAVGSAASMVMTARRTQPVEIPIVLQSELGEAPKPHSSIEVFKMVQARSSAHTYAWMDMCLTCGSAGLNSEMIFCVDCGEGFHTFCVPGMSSEKINESEHLQAFWRCQNCKMCEVCGRPGGDNDFNALHFCGHCDRGYHGPCMLPALKKPHQIADASEDAKEKTAQMYCSNCVTCQECGKDQPEMTYSYDRSVCLSCSQSKLFESTLKQEKSKPLQQIWTAEARKQKKDSEKCPLCKLRWDPEDEDLIQCDACELWAHPKCDSLLTDEPERYKKLVEDPSALYICGVCRPKERANLSSIPNTWKCQVLIDMIQQKRDQTEAKWKEAREQLEQAKQWKYWKDQTPVYLYILRLGEECLKNLAFRSVNFRENWFRFTKEQELADSGVMLPSWLVQKASRYLRFKRYSRGPKASLRRQSRKSSSFYSQHGVEKQKDASVVSTIVSEACSCAALLACVHLLYGWRSLPRVVLHLLGSDAARDQGHEQLSDQTRKMLCVESPAMTLDEEIVMIKKQYERRIGKKPVARAATDTGESKFSDRVEGKTSPSSSLAVTTTDASEKLLEIPTTPRTSESRQLIKMTKAAPLCGWPAAELSDCSTPGQDVSGSTAVQSAPGGEARPKFVDNRFCSFCFMIGDDLMCGRLMYTDKDQWVHVNCALWSVEVYETVDGVLQKCQKAKNRSRLLRCDACGVLGASVGCAVSRCQRHFHFPCAYDYGVVFLPNGETCCPKPEHIAMVSRKQKLAATSAQSAIATEAPAEVVTIEAALLEESAPTVERKDVEMTTDDGVRGSAALESQPTEVEVAENPDLSPSEEVSKSDDQSEAKPESVNSGTSSEAAPVSSESTADVPDNACELDQKIAIQEVLSRNGDSTLGEETSVPESNNAIVVVAPETSASGEVQDNLDVVTADAHPVVPVPLAPAPVLPVVDPSPEPRRHLRSDLPIVTSDFKKQGNKSRRQKRPQSIRMGALTVQSFGHIVVGNPSFHSREAIFPLGFRSTRIFWSSRSLQTRCLYECVITNTDIEDRLKEKNTKDKSKDKKPIDPDQEPRPRARAIFKIVASDDRERPIVAFTADDALIELRGRLVALYEEQQCSFGDFDKNPFVSRSSWFSYGLLGTHFFGFGIPDIVREIEQLPHAATTSISRSLISRRLNAQSSSSRKRRRDEMMKKTSTVSDGREDPSETSEEVYVFTQHLPEPKQLEDALHEIEQLVTTEERARLSSGSTRTDGFEGVVDHEASEDAPRVIRRRLNKQASREPESLGMGGPANNNSGGANTTNSSGASATNASATSTNANATGNTTGSGGANTKGSSGMGMDLEHLPIAMQYRELRRRPFDERLEVRKSKIHGYGLFTKEKMAEGQMIVEYQGQMIAQSVADERERFYEEKGIGSCYMFRLDDKTIIDATRVGNLARFINHSCDPKAFARVVTVEGNEKKIVIFAKRAIDAGDEVTYDYKFPIEDEAIRCDCSAPNCIGRMN
ncbi:Histone-lysine n-methyltransferase [Globisporangium polare]